LLAGARLLNKEDKSVQPESEGVCLASHTSVPLSSDEDVDIEDVEPDDVDVDSTEIAHDGILTSFIYCLSHASIGHSI